MGMAGSLAKRKPDLPAKLTSNQKLAIELLVQGKSLYAVAKELAARNGHSARTYNRILRRWLTQNEMVQKELAMAAQSELVGGTPKVARAVVNRGGRGNPNMARLALEASGFHNPKVDHKHSGEVKITLSGIPRPSAGPDETPPVTDAEVIED
jgi:hypothetical protein